VSSLSSSPPLFRAPPFPLFPPPLPLSLQYVVWALVGGGVGRHGFIPPAFPPPCRFPLFLLFLFSFFFSYPPTETRVVSASPFPSPLPLFPMFLSFFFLSSLPLNGWKGYEKLRARSIIPFSSFFSFLMFSLFFPFSFHANDGLYGNKRDLGTLSFPSSPFNLSFSFPPPFCFPRFLWQEIVMVFGHLTYCLSFSFVAKAMVYAIAFDVFISLPPCVSFLFLAIKTFKMVGTYLVSVSSLFPLGPFLSSSLF